MSHPDIPTGYKKSPIGVIPVEWEVKELGMLCLKKGEYGINAPAVNFHENLPTYLRITDIDENGRFIKADKKSVDSLESAKYLLKNGDIVFARTGATVGKTYLYSDADGPLVFAGFLIRFQSDPLQLLPYYLKLFSETKLYWDWVQTVSQRSGQPGINSQEYASLQIPLPPLPEQQKIAAILATWDRAIQGAEQLLQALRRRNKGLAQRLFAPKEGWNEVRLGEVFRERNETGFTDLQLLSITGDRGVILQSENEKRDVSNTDKSKYKRICPGDIGYNTMRMWQGRSAISSLEGIVSPAYTIVVPKREVDVEYMGKLFKHPDVVHLFFKKSQGLVDDTLNCKFPEFAKVIVKIPPLPEQTRIATLLATADREAALHERRLHALREQKRGLMQSLLTGRIRVK